MAVVVNGVSYDIAQVRQVMNAFENMRALNPTFLSLVGTGANATNTKVEWAEDTMSPIATTITSISTNDITVPSVVGFEIGSIVKFATSADVTQTEQCVVTNIVGNVMTLARSYGGTTGSTLLATMKVQLVSTPRAEGTDATAGNATDPSLEYNYTEIFDDKAQVSLTTNAVNTLSVEDALAYEELTAFQRNFYRMNNSVIHGRRVARTGTTAGTTGTMGGVLQYCAKGNVNVAGGALSKTQLNDMMESIFAKGGFSNNYAILCNTNQARRISAFNTTGSNPVVQIPQGSTMTGGYISQFMADLPVMGGFSAKVVVEPSMPKDQIAIVDMNKVELAFLRPLTWKDATPQGADYIRSRLIGEMTLRVKDGGVAHAMATGLTV